MSERVNKYNLFSPLDAVNVCVDEPYKEFIPGEDKLSLLKIP